LEWLTSCGAPTWPPNPQTFAAPRRSRGASLEWLTSCGAPTWSPCRKEPRRSSAPFSTSAYRVGGGGGGGGGPAGGGGGGGGPAGQPGARPDGRARRRTAGGRADRRAERGPEHGPDGRAGDGVPGARLVDARADLLRGKLATDGVVPLELLEGLSGPGQHHHGGALGHRDTGAHGEAHDNRGRECLLHRLNPVSEAP